MGSLLVNLGENIITAMLSAVAWVMNWLVAAAASFFEGMLGIGFTHTLNTIQLGWAACRDFANMLFILFMVIIAFATILRIEQYGVKKLLPKVIGVALLINFSMVFCLIIVDFSNLTANFFIKDIKGKINGSDGKNGAITATFADAFNLTSVYSTYTNCDDYISAMKANYCDNLCGVGTTDCTKKTECYSRIDSQRADCEKILTNYGSVRDADAPKVTFWNIVLGYTVGSIILLIAAFTLFAGGLMLLFRIIAIWFLVTISPLVCICYIMPSLRSNWQKWWKTFINWCIFAPAYAFFVWMAIQIATSSTIKNIQGEAIKSTLNPSYGALNSKFITNPGEQLIGYFIIIGFLIGGLIVAKNLGIYGADTVMKIAKGAQKGATGWAKRNFVTRPALKTGGVVGGAALGVGAKLFGDTKLGRRMGAKSAQLKQAIAQTKDNKAYANLLKTMNDKDTLREVETANGVRKLIATQEAKRRGLLREAKRPYAIRAMRAMRAYGDEEGARSLEELRPDTKIILNEKGNITSESQKQLTETMERSIKEGTHKKFSAEVLRSPEGKFIIQEMIRQLGPSEFAKTYNGWTKDIKTVADETMISTFTNDFDKTSDGKDNSNVEMRKTYAKATGDIAKAFAGLAESLAENYVQGLNAEGFAKLKNTESKQMAGKYMSDKQVYSVGISITNGEDKRIIMEAAKENDNKLIYETMETSEVWGGKSKQPTQKQSQQQPKTTEDVRKPEPKNFVVTDQEAKEQERLKAAEEAARKRERL